MLLILKTPWIEEEEFKSNLRRLVINVDAYVANGQGQTRDAPSTETVFTGSVADVSDPFIVIDEEGSESDGESAQQIYAMWKLPVYIARPRMRLQSPCIMFSASAAQKPRAALDLPSKTSGYLPSGQASGLNLLESFSNDPHLHGVKPRLSVLRVSRVAPVTRGHGQVARLRALPQLQLPIHAIVHSRIRFLRPQASPPSSTILGLLEFDFTPDFECEVLLDKIDLITSSGTVENLSDDAALKLPLSCVAHDHITFLYQIQRNSINSGSKDTGGILDVAVSASVLVAPGFCTPRIDMKWAATLDFTNKINASLGTPTETGIQRSHRPAQLSLSSSQNVVTPLKSPSVTQPDALPTLEASAIRGETKLPDLGITMSFSAPTDPVYPGDVFCWTVYVLNRASEKSARAPRKLALVPIPKRRRHESRPVRPPSTASKRKGEKDVADVALDENVLHALQKNAILDGVDIVSLNADTRVGPLGPGACHVVELQFLAVRPGIAEMEAIRVVDLGSQEHVDILGLPVTIIEQPLAT